MRPPTDRLSNQTPMCGYVSALPTPSSLKCGGGCRFRKATTERSGTGTCQKAWRYSYCVKTLTPRFTRLTTPLPVRSGIRCAPDGKTMLASRLVALRPASRSGCEAARPGPAP
jgi:hypothetical protein